MKILSIDEMLEVAHEILPNDQCEAHVRAVEDAATNLGQRLAKHLKVRINGPATFEPGFGGTCVAFCPKFENQPCPDAIEQMDSGGDWE